MGLSVVKKLSIVGLAVLATVGIGAYPMTVYVGNKIYDQQFERFEAKGILKYEELSKSFANRKGRVKILTANPDVYIVANTNTDFGLLGAKIDIIPDYTENLLKDILEQSNIENAPESKISIEYRVSSDDFDLKGNIGSFVAKDADMKCYVDNITFNSVTKRMAIMPETPENIIEAIDKSQKYTTYNINVPEVKCTSRDFTIFDIKNVNITNDMVSQLLGNLKINVDEYSLNLGNKFANFGKNVSAEVELLKGTNNSYGLRTKFNVEKIDIDYPQNLFNNNLEKGALYTIENVDVDDSVINISRLDLVRILNAFKDLGTVITGNYDLNTIGDIKPEVKVEKLNLVINKNGYFRANGDVKMPIFADFFDFRQIEGVMNLQSNWDFIMATDPQSLLPAAKLFVLAGLITEQENKKDLSTKVTFYNGILLNDMLISEALDNVMGSSREETATDNKE